MLRRSFLRATGSLTAALTVPEALLADPYGDVGFTREGAVGAYTRIRGRVSAGGRAVAGVGITDGVTTVTTDRDGQYTLIAAPGAQFVSIRLPAGFGIPVQRTGTAQLHQAILPDNRGEAEASFTIERLPVDDVRHVFLLLADPQTQNALEVGRLHAETVPDVQGTVSALWDRNVFGIACGDIMFDDLTLYPEYERAVTAMGVPFFQVVGNHDLDFAGRTDETSVATFESRFGRGYYSFDRGEVHYVVLDDVLWFGSDYVDTSTGDSSPGWRAISRWSSVAGRSSSASTSLSPAPGPSVSAMPSPTPGGGCRTRRRSTVCSSHTGLISCRATPTRTSTS